MQGMRTKEKGASVMSEGVWPPLVLPPRMLPLRVPPRVLPLRALPLPRSLWLSSRLNSAAMRTASACTSELRGGRSVDWEEEEWVPESAS
jgi:hypothetical protein